MELKKSKITKIALLPFFLFVVCFSLSEGSLRAALNSGSTIEASVAKVEKRAAGRAQAALPQVRVMKAPRSGYTRYPWKKNIVATVFWVGEDPTKNNPVPNDKSSWDPAWERNFGGYDHPHRRTRDFLPKGFIPGQNPFYVALPYNDVAGIKKTKAEASKIIPWFKRAYRRAGKSVLKSRWIAISHSGRTCFAQWEDCGPFSTNDWQYVFGDKRPKNKKNRGAGIDISPAVRDYLGLRSGEKCDWRFVELPEVKPGPWQYYGKNNHFVRKRNHYNTEYQERLAQLRKARDEWFRAQ